MGAPGEITNQESPSQAPHHSPQRLLADLWVGNNLAWSPAPVIFHNTQGSFTFQSPSWLGGAMGRALAQGFPMVPLSWLLCNHWVLENYGCHRLLEAGKRFLGPKRGSPNRQTLRMARGFQIKSPKS